MPDFNNDEKLCPRCGVVKNKSEFYKRTENKERLGGYCKQCVSEISVIRCRENKIKFLDYKGGKCSRCGYNKCVSALELHCIDSKNKDIDIKKIKNRKFNQKIKDILDKCIVLCVNCHRLEHHNIYLSNKGDIK